MMLWCNKINNVPRGNENGFGKLRLKNNNIMPAIVVHLILLNFPQWRFHHRLNCKVDKPFGRFLCRFC